MARLHGPLFSEKAQKQLGHNLIYKRKGPKNILTKYNKPGGVAPFTPSASQETMRGYMKDGRDAWAGLPDSDKKAWRDFVKPKRGE